MLGYKILGPVAVLAGQLCAVTLQLALNSRLRREVTFKVSFVSYKRWHFKSCIATMEDPLRPKVG